MFSKLNRSDIFVIFWVLYYLQGTLYNSTLINKSLQAIMFFWLFVEFVIELYKPNKPKLINATIALFFMYLIYGLINIIFGKNINIGYQIPTYFYLQKAGNSLMPIILYYHYTRLGYVTEKRIRIYFFVFLITSLVLFNQESAHMYDIASADQSGVTNNAGYGMLALIPMVYYFYRKPLVQYAFLALLLAIVLLGAKRGAIVAGAACMLYYVFVSYRGGRKKNYSVLLSVLFVLIALYYVQYAFRTNEYLAYRYEQTLDGNTSNRDIIYGIVWDALLNEASPISLLFGHGADSTLKIIGNFAHQDWLEIAFNNGLIGVFLFLMFFISYIVNIRDARRSLPSWQVHAFVTILIIGFLKSMFSAFITQIDLCMSVVIGYTLAQLINNGRIENNRIIKDAKSQYNN